MAKTIKLTSDILDEIKNEFLTKLAAAKFSDGKISYQKTFGTVARKAKIIFTETAWIKMQELVRRFDTEVGWHGIAKRGPDETKDEYIITDILVYPQVVAAATVTPDQVEYQNWLMGQPDEIFNNIRMQGHSHVNMGVTPSGVDTNFYDSIIAQMDDTMFYIFMIWNKKGDKTIKIYDMAKNVLFETSDCTIEVEPDELGIETFVSNAKSVVKAAAKPTYMGGGWSGTTYQGYLGYQYGGVYNQPQTTQKSEPAKAAPAAEKKEEPKKEAQKKEEKSGIRRGRRRDPKDGKAKLSETRYSLDNWLADGYDDSSDYYERWR